MKLARLVKMPILETLSIDLGTECYIHDHLYPVYEPRNNLSLAVQEECNETNR